MNGVNLMNTNHSHSFFYHTIAIPDLNLMIVIVQIEKSLLNAD